MDLLFIEFEPVALQAPAASFDDLALLDGDDHIAHSRPGLLAVEVARLGRVIWVRVVVPDNVHFHGTGLPVSCEDGTRIDEVAIDAAILASVLGRENSVDESSYAVLFLVMTDENAAALLGIGHGGVKVDGM